MSSFTELIVFFFYLNVCVRNAHIHIHIDRRSKAVLLSREECTIVLVLLLLFLLSFLCNQKSSCLTITGDMIYNHFFFCLSLESLRWHIHSNFFCRHLISTCFRPSFIIIIVFVHSSFYWSVSMRHMSMCKKNSQARCCLSDNGYHPSRRRRWR